MREFFSIKKPVHSEKSPPYPIQSKSDIPPMIGCPCCDKCCCSGVVVLCLYITYFWPLVIKSLEGASAVSSGAHLLRKCERVFFSIKKSHGLRVLGLGLQTQEP